MAIVPFSNKVSSIGILNPNMRVFDVIMRTEYGTSYNAYLVKGAEKTALIETVHHHYYEEYVANVHALCNGKAPDYIIMNHNEPDHSGSLARIMQDFPNAQIVTSQAGSIYLKNITNQPLSNLLTVKNGTTLDLGGGDVLKFILAPFLHWPDSMFTWYEKEKTLFSCDFLGAHYCEPRMISDKIAYLTAYDSAFLNYYNAIFSPFKPYVLAGLEKIKDLDIALLCPSHGPALIGESIAVAKQKYKDWSQPHKNEQVTIPIFYSTAYGNTRILAKTIAQGIASVLPHAVVTLDELNAVTSNMAELTQKMHHSDAFLVGSPTINRDAVAPIWSLIAAIDAVSMKDRPCAVFGSYGWSGEACPNLIARLQGLKMKVFPTPCKAQFVPSEQELEQAFAFGAEFAHTL